tara:strand:- start:2526 stop:3560 length:1035 start_codon:yes stop_codon:yes gene_type:complete
MLKIIYLSRNISKIYSNQYVSSSYQQDVINELSNNCNLYNYGPGYKDFNIKDNIEDIIKKSSFNPDAIVFGHNWLSDDDRSISISLMDNLSLMNLNIPKILILNKEYVNLKRKLEYIKNIKFDFILSHHHEVENYKKQTNLKFIFWPFACHKERFLSRDDKKEVDLFFSGILQNQYKHAHQSEFRLNCLNQIYHTVFDHPLLKRRKFKKYNIIWNSVPRTLKGRILKKILGERLFDYDDYAKLIKGSKIVINSPSPIGLISPRYFECMLSKCLIFCEESNLYNNIFDKDSFVILHENAEDLEEKLIFYLNNPKHYEKKTNDAFNEVLSKHTWKNRIDKLLDLIN